MPGKLMAIILSLGLISGIGIAGIGNASAAAKPKPIPSSAQRSTVASRVLADFQQKTPVISIPLCRIVTIVMPVAGFVIVTKKPNNKAIVGAIAVATSFSNWICP
ncbi:MAG: hypothetical protein Q7R42_08930 [Candidatus Planktophila sp.]|nr:hypothetical protein [Candidatus Planktophila sp.]